MHVDCMHYCAIYRLRHYLHVYLVEGVKYSSTYHSVKTVVGPFPFSVS